MRERRQNGRRRRRRGRCRRWLGSEEDRAAGGGRSGAAQGADRCKQPAAPASRASDNRPASSESSAATASGELSFDPHMVSKDPSIEAEDGLKKGCKRRRLVHAQVPEERAPSTETPSIEVPSMHLSPAQEDLVQEMQKQSSKRTLSAPPSANLMLEVNSPSGGSPALVPLREVQAELNSTKVELETYKAGEDEHFEIKRKAYLESPDKFGKKFTQHISRTLSHAAKGVLSTITTLYASSLRLLLHHAYPTTQPVLAINITTINRDRYWKLRTSDFLYFSIHTHPNSPPSFTTQRGRSVSLIETVGRVVNVQHTDETLTIHIYDDSDSIPCILFLQPHAEHGDDPVVSPDITRRQAASVDSEKLVKVRGKIALSPDGALQLIGCCVTVKHVSYGMPAHLFFSYLLSSFHDIFLLQQQISTAALISSHLAKMNMFAAIHVMLLARDFLSLTVHNPPNSPPSFFRRGMQVWRVQTVAVVSRDRSASRDYAEGGRDELGKLVRVRGLIMLGARVGLQLTHNIRWKSDNRRLGTCCTIITTPRQADAIQPVQRLHIGIAFNQHVPHRQLQSHPRPQHDQASYSHQLAQLHCRGLPQRNLSMHFCLETKFRTVHEVEDARNASSPIVDDEPEIVVSTLLADHDSNRLYTPNLHTSPEKERRRIGGVVDYKGEKISCQKLDVQSTQGRGLLQQLLLAIGDALELLPRKGLREEAHVDLDCLRVLVGLDSGDEEPDEEPKVNVEIVKDDGWCESICENLEIVTENDILYPTS
ncbi:hypothetical protein ZIOFF_009280 [Zingiber officinale]|uniref:Uncharacterized protein n=1 Tax=Zingiber officinale TaxID=94328 RepID=A0A8J5HH46_ZINOF|nr:hypothetical protein ZIOFF_009280 [Zingiber officinale]